MRIKHKCNNEIVFSSAEKRIVERKCYDEHADMHYDGGGWSTWNETIYDVNKCGGCGKYHSFRKDELC